MVAAEMIGSTRLRLICQQAADKHGSGQNEQAPAKHGTFLRTLPRGREVFIAPAG